MKKTTLIILLIFASITVKCQNANIITQIEYDNIKINNIKLIDVKNTLGKQNAIEELFGAVNNAEIDSDGDFYHYIFNGFSIGFSSIISDGTYIKPILSRFEITNNNSFVTIRGVTIAIGTNINILENIVFNSRNDGSKSILYMACSGCNNFIVIDFNQTTKLITKITYIELT